MSQTVFPAGWDEEKVRRVLAYYEAQTEDDALLEDEAGVEPSDTVMKVPHDLVPKLRSSADPANLRFLPSSSHFSTRNLVGPFRSSRDERSNSNPPNRTPPAALALAINGSPPPASGHRDSCFAWQIPGTRSRGTR